MVLNELTHTLSKALHDIGQKPSIDSATLDAFLKEVCTALLQADVNVRQVSQLRAGVKNRVNVEQMAAGLNKQRIIEKAVFEELCAILDSSPGEPFKLDAKKNKQSVVMFVGLQGSGKTTTCSKYAYHYKKKGMKPALVCADTFRAGAFDQLKQNASKTQTPFYGSYKETDPAVIAQEGVDMFKKDGKDLIIVDTSGRHRQEAALFEEMRQVAAAIQPDLVVFVMDGSIGQAAYEQAKAFKDSVEVGGVILTKLDGHAKGGGALSAVAATKSPIIFLGVGEQLDDLQAFDTKRFVGRLIGKGDVGALVDKIQDAIPEDKQPELLDTISKGNMSMRVMRDMFDSVLELGPASQMMSMLPGFNSELMPQGNDKASQQSLRRFITIIESMDDKELDSTQVKMLQEPSRVARLAKGSGRSAVEVLNLIEAYKHYSKYATQALKAAHLPKNIGKMKGDVKMNDRHMMDSLQKMSQALPPQMMKQLGGPAGLKNLMKQMDGKVPGGGLEGLMGGMGGRRR